MASPPGPSQGPQTPAPAVPGIPDITEAAIKTYPAFFLDDKYGEAQEFDFTITGWSPKKQKQLPLVDDVGNHAGWTDWVTTLVTCVFPDNYSLDGMLKALQSMPVRRNIEFRNFEGVEETKLKDGTISSATWEKLKKKLHKLPDIKDVAEGDTQPGKTGKKKKPAKDGQPQYRPSVLAQAVGKEQATMCTTCEGNDGTQTTGTFKSCVIAAHQVLDNLKMDNMLKMTCANCYHGTQYRSCSYHEQNLQHLIEEIRDFRKLARDANIQEEERKAAVTDAETKSAEEIQSSGLDIAHVKEMADLAAKITKELEKKLVKANDSLTKGTKWLTEKAHAEVFFLGNGFKEDAGFDKPNNVKKPRRVLQTPEAKKEQDEKDKAKAAERKKRKASAATDDDDDAADAASGEEVPSGPPSKKRATGRGKAAVVVEVNDEDDEM